MTQLDRIKLRMPDEIFDTNKELLFQDLLDTAKNDILRRRYPFKSDLSADAQLEYRYLDLQIELALIRYNMLGVEGQKEHDENGIRRVYENTLLNSVLPYVTSL